MKKLVLFLSCLAAVLSYSVQDGFTADLSKKFLCKCYSVSYPSGWTVSTEGTVNQPDGFKVHLKSNSPSGSNIMITMLPASADFTTADLEALKKSAIDSYSAQFIVYPRITDFKYGMTVHQVYTMMNKNGIKCRVIQFLVKKDQMVYILTASFDESQYSQEIDAVMKTIDSFEVE